jgi:hypothetical protein
MLNIDPNRPDIPSIARILSTLGILCLVGSIGGMLLTFSGYRWVNEIAALAGAGAAFLIGVLFIGQAKTIELLALVSARVKSRFAIEHAVIPAPQAAAPAAERKPAPTVAIPQERVITIPEEVARQQGVTRRREPI